MIPMFAVEGKNHGTILSDPADDLADQVVNFLNVSSNADLEAWTIKASAWNHAALKKMTVDRKGQNDGWQQFVVHVIDEYGNPVPDYVVDLFHDDPTGLEPDQLSAIEFTDFDLDVHAYAADKSFRCFHVRLPQGILKNGAGKLWLRLTASSGTEYIAYQGYGSTNAILTEVSPVLLDISQYANGDDSLFAPFSTTLVEIRVNREPLPFRGQTKLMTMRPFSA